MHKSKQNTKVPERILSRRLARTLTSEQLLAIAGGAAMASTTSCCPCADDCDTMEN